MARPAAPLPTTRAAITTMSPSTLATAAQLRACTAQLRVCTDLPRGLRCFHMKPFFYVLFSYATLCSPPNAQSQSDARCTFASAYYIYQLGAPDLRITLSQSKVLRRGRGEPAAQALSPEQAACRKPHAASPHAASAQRAGGRGAAASSVVRNRKLKRFLGAAHEKTEGSQTSAHASASLKASHPPATRTDT